MSWESKQDYCGLAVTNKVAAKSANKNTSGQYLEKLGAHGDIVATKPYGEVSNPSNDYAIEAAHTYEALKLGAIMTVDNKAYALESVHYEKTAGSEPVLSAQAKEVEAGATTAGMNVFEVPDLAVSPDEIAEIIFEAATLSGTGCELTKCTADIACTVNPHTVNGTPVASDTAQGKITVQLTIGQYGTTVPTVAAESGWEISAPLTVNDPDSDMPEWTCTLEKPLAKTMASSQSNT